MAENKKKNLVLEFEIKATIEVRIGSDNLSDVDDLIEHIQTVGSAEIIGIKVK
jgi:Holliday junction resolvase